MSDKDSWWEKFPTKMLSGLLRLLESKSYEIRQAGIQTYLRRVYRLKSSTAKMQAVALLDAKLNEKKIVLTGSEPIYEFPEPEEIEDWLTQMFFEEDFSGRNPKTSVPGPNSASY